MWTSIFYRSCISAVTLAWVSSASAAVLQMDFNTDGVLPHQENTNLTRTNDSPGTTLNTNSETVSGGYWTGDYRLGQQSATGTRPRLLYYAGNNPSIAAGANVPLSINVRMRFLAPVTVQGTNANADRDFAIRARNGSGLLLMLFNYSTDGTVNQIIGQSSGGATAVNTGVSFADFHTYTFVWDGLFDGTGSLGESDVVDVYVDGSFVGVTRGFSGGANTNGYIEFGDGSTNDGTHWQVDWIHWGTGPDAAVVTVPEPVFGASTMLLCGMALGRRNRR